jgi:hypothetical protein
MSASIESLRASLTEEATHPGCARTALMLLDELERTRAQLEQARLVEWAWLFRCYTSGGG